MNATFTVFRQSDRKKNPTPVAVRRLTRSEIMALGNCHHVPVILNSGRLGEVKINGAIRTWKRDPDRVEIPVKYGMYEFTTLNLEEALQRFVCEIGCTHDGLDRSDDQIADEIDDIAHSLHAGIAGGFTTKRES